MKIPTNINKNRTLLLEHINPFRENFRNEMIEKTQLSPATVFRITKQLVEESAIFEVGSKSDAVGRPTPAFEVNKNAGIVLGVSLSMNQARCLTLDLKGNTRDTQICTFDLKQGVDGILNPLRKVINSALENRAAWEAPLKMLGLALPGVWDPKNNLSISFPRLVTWKNIPLIEKLSKVIDVPVIVTKYNTSLAIAEHAIGIERESQNLMCVEVDENIAMGGVINGQPMEGFSGKSGELGHITIDPFQGKLCHCGNTGCLETLATSQAVIEQITQSAATKSFFLGNEAISYENIIKLAESENTFACRVLRQAATYLSIGIANATNILNPDAIVLNGRFFDAGDLVLDPIKETLQRRAFPGLMDKVRVSHSNLGDNAPAIGAGIKAIKTVIKEL